MNRLIISLALYLLAFPASICVARQMSLFTSDGDLSSVLVNKIMQDSRGFLWVATENGLNQFDGIRFKTFYKEKDNPASLLSNYVHTIYELRDSTILVGCINGLMRYNPSSDTFTEYKMVYKGRKVKAHVSDMLELSSGELLIATAGYGIFSLDKETRKASFVSDMTKAAGNEFVSCLYEDSAHTIWIGTERTGLSRYYPTSNKWRSYRMPEISGNIVKSFQEDADGSILVGSLDGGVDRYDRLRENFSPVAYAGSGQLCVSSLCKVDGKVFACTDGYGVFEITGDEARQTFFGMSALMVDTNQKVHQVLSDKEGNLWFCIYQRGIVLKPRNEFRFRNLGASLNPWVETLEKCVMAVYVDRGRHIWVSRDNNGGVECYGADGALLRHYDMPATVMSFMADSQGALWAGTYTHGVLRLDASGQWLPVEGLGDRKIYSMEEAADGKVYIGSLDRGLECYDPASKSVFDCIGKLRIDKDGTTANSLNSVNGLCYTNGGKLWVAHYCGISCYDTKMNKFDVFNSAVNLINDCIGYVVYEDRSGTMWFGTSEGLYSYDVKTKASRHYTVDSGMPSNVVSGICQDNEGNLWVSTYHGIARMSPGGDFMCYDAGDGLQGNEFTHGAFHMDEYGVMYFGGSKGVTYFHPSDIAADSEQHSPVITEVGAYSPADGESGGLYRVVMANCHDRARVRLSYDENTVDIYFTTLSYANPSKIQYEYRIKQSGDSWIATAPGQNKVTFYNLSPGAYDFQLRTVAQPDVVTSLKIVITPPWYLSWWAKLLYLVVAMAVIVVIIKYIRQRKRELREIEQRRQSEKLSEAKLQLFTNISHDIRTPMTLIIDPLRKLIANCNDSKLLPQYNVIYRNAWRIMALVNQLMDIRKFDNGQMRMRARATDMVGFVEDVLKPFELYSKEHNVAINFHHDMERMECWIDLEHFDKVLMNLLSNALKHTPNDGQIDITLSKAAELDDDGEEPEMLEIEVKDSGEGIREKDFDHIFEPFFQSVDKGNGLSPGTGIGLHLTKLIVNMHKGSIVAMNRSDRSGAIFRVRIPLGNSHLAPEELMSPGDMEREIMRQPVILKEKQEVTEAKTRNRVNAAIVVVEDDPEIRGYLHQILSAHYRSVITYTKAEDALKDILSMPDTLDLVISDVMLDGLDGLSFTRRLKQNANTNHIPVVLVSAKSDIEDIKAGIESGADHYIVKPFSSEILLSTIYNVMSNRHLLKVKFSGNQKQEERIERIKMNSADEVLMERVMATINRNLSSPEFSVEKLAAEVGLSRAHLHRKLKELTNFSSRDFIRNIRMKQAADLLKENKFSIAEVAYATGFSNPSHFSNVFKDFHGVTPTQFTAKHSDNHPSS